MAEHDLKITVSADTADAKKKLEDIGKTKIEPVKVPVEADKVKVDAPKVTPIKVPVEADQVKVDVVQPEPVKVDVVQPETVRVAVEKPAPVEVAVEPVKPVKVPVEKPNVKIEAKPTKIIVTADDEDAKRKIEELTGTEGIKRIRVVAESGELASRKSGKERFEIEADLNDRNAAYKIAELTKNRKIHIEAEIGESGISKGIGALGSLRTAVQGVIRALGAIGMFVAIGTAVAGAVMRIKEAFEATGKEIAGMRFKDYVNDITSGTERMLSAQGKLNKLLEKEQETIRKTREVRDAEAKGNDAAEDAARVADRAYALSKEKNPRKRKHLEGQYAAEDEEIEEARRKRDSRQREKDFDEDASVYSSKSKGAKAKADEIKEQIKAQEELANLMKLSKAGKLDKEDRGWWELGGLATPKALAGPRNRVNQIKAMDDPEVKAAYDKLSELRKAYDEMLKASEEYSVEAERLSKKSEIERTTREKTDASKGGKSAAKEQADAENEAIDQEDRRKLEKHQKRMRRAETEDAWRSENIGADDETKIGNLTIRENIAKDRLDKAEEALAEEMEKEAKDRDAVKISELMGEAEQAQSDMFGFRSQREAIEKSSREKQISDLESSAERAQSVDAVSQNRLTAMGLGSGVSANGGVRTELNRVIDLLREQIRATKDIKPVEIDTTATFSE